MAIRCPLLRSQAERQGGDAKVKERRVGDTDSAEALWQWRNKTERTDWLTGRQTNPLSAIGVAGHPGPVERGHWSQTPWAGETGEGAAAAWGVQYIKVLLEHSGSNLKCQIPCRPGDSPVQRGATLSKMAAGLPLRCAASWWNSFQNERSAQTKKSLEDCRLQLSWIQGTCPGAGCPRQSSVGGVLFSGKWRNLLCKLFKCSHSGQSKDDPKWSWLCRECFSHWQRTLPVVLFYAPASWQYKMNPVIPNSKGFGNYFTGSK